MENLSLISYSLSLKNIWAKKRFTYTTVEYTELNRIALLTANDGGPGVYNARVMLSMMPGQQQRSTERHSDTTGLGSAEKEFYFGKLYPNPARDDISIDYYIDGKHVAVLSFYDISGRLVYENNLKADKNNLVINTSNLEHGVYLYTIQLDGKKQEKGKVIIIK